MADKVDNEEEDDSKADEEDEEGGNNYCGMLTSTATATSE